MKKLSIFLAIIAIAFSFSSCNPTGGTIVSPDDPIVKPVVSDSVVVEITIVLPSCAELTATEILISNSIFQPYGIFGGGYKGGDKVFTYTFKDEVAKALLSTKTDFNARINAWDCQHNASLWTPVKGIQTIQLQKGLNKVLLEYRAGS